VVRVARTIPIRALRAVRVAASGVGGGVVAAAAAAHKAQTSPKTRQQTLREIKAPRQPANARKQARPILATINKQKGVAALPRRVARIDKVGTENRVNAAVVPMIAKANKANKANKADKVGPRGRTGEIKERVTIKMHGAKRAAMVVVLPRQSATPVQALALADVSTQAAAFKFEQVHLEIPKFKFDAKFKLSDALKALKMRLAFTPAADFRGISASREFAISEVIHKTYIDVDENGTEAAAATGITVKSMSLPLKTPTPPKEFIADHPFLFFIRDLKSGVNYFVGWLNQPSPA